MAKNEREEERNQRSKKKKKKNIVQRVENEWTELIMSRGEIIYKGEFLFPR